jgi:hypothetical protein
MGARAAKFRRTGLSADIIQIRDYQKPKPTLDEQAKQFMGELRAAILEADKLLYESSMGHKAPEKDPA